MLSTTSNRAGRFVSHGSGYWAFIPAALPPEPPVSIDSEMLRLLSQADLALGRLDGIVKVVPDPDFFVGMYVRREAVLSSPDRGNAEHARRLARSRAGARARAAIRRCRRHRELHPRDEIRMAACGISPSVAPAHPGDTRGAATRRAGRSRDAGRVQAKPKLDRSRRRLNFDGVVRAAPVPEMKQALNDFERFLHSDDALPTLFSVGLSHAQFETIHPFLDGNGRVRRLLITFQLLHAGVLRRPLLYLSYFFKLHRAEYYDRLMAVRLNGDWKAGSAYSYGASRSQRTKRPEQPSSSSNRGSGTALRFSRQTGLDPTDSSCTPCSFSARS